MKSNIFNKNPEFMSIDDAIKHCKEVIINADCEECADQHFQLVKWLEELKFYRANFYMFEDKYLKILNTMYGD